MPQTYFTADWHFSLPTVGIDRQIGGQKKSRLLFIAPTLFQTTSKAACTLFFIVR